MPRQYKMSLRIVLLCCLISAVYAEVFAAHKQYRDDIHMIKNTADLDMVTFDKVSTWTVTEEAMVSNRVRKT